MDKAEIVKLREFLRRSFGAPMLQVVPNSKSGEILLNSLYLYCDSYEQWQFSRWLHHLKPHNFNQQIKD